MVINQLAEVMSQIIDFLKENASDLGVSESNIEINHPMNAIAPPTPYINIFAMANSGDDTIPEIPNIQPIEVSVFVATDSDDNLGVATIASIEQTAKVRRLLATGFDGLNFSRITPEIITSDSCLHSFSFTLPFEVI